MTYIQSEARFGCTPMTRSSPEDFDALSETSQRIYEALYGTIWYEGVFTPDDNAHSATPLDPNNLYVGGLSFPRVSAMYLESILANERVANLSLETQALIGYELRVTSERRIQKNNLNMKLLSHMIQDRVETERLYGVEPKYIDPHFLNTIIDLRKGQASLEQEVMMLELLPEIGSLEAFKTTCPFDVDLMKRSTDNLHSELDLLQSHRPDWEIKNVAPRDSQARFVVTERNMVSSKWISATIHTRHAAFELITKQSDMILEKDTDEPIVRRNLRRLPDGNFYEVQPLTAMQYLRPAKATVS